MALLLRSEDFSPGGEIPQQFTCEGADDSPALAWTGVPPEARSLALVLEDPDAPDPAAPRTIWTHWLLYNLPPTSSGLPRAVPGAQLPPGTREGKNSWDRLGYGGPCPPIGRHRYFHRLYALNALLPDLKHPTRAALMAAMNGHVLDEAELMGTYRKQER